MKEIILIAVCLIFAIVVLALVVPFVIDSILDLSDRIRERKEKKKE